MKPLILILDRPYTRQPMAGSINITVPPDHAFQR